MATFRAKYPGKCAMCQRPIVPGQFIRAARGERARHDDCNAAGKGDILWRERKLVNAAHAMAAWTQKNPPPDLDRQVVAQGGPTPPDLSEYFDDEERRMARGRYDDERAAWLRGHPDLVTRHAAAMQAWQARRAAVDADIRKAR